MGIAYVDAPVLGTTSDAESGELEILVGGSETAVGLATAHLRNLGKDIQHVGPTGTAHAVKSLVSLHTAASLAVSAEILCAAKFLSIPPASMAQILGSAAGPRSFSATYLSTILSGDFDSRFRLENCLAIWKPRRKSLTRGRSKHRSPTRLSIQQEPQGRLSRRPTRTSPSWCGTTSGPMAFCCTNLTLRTGSDNTDMYITNNHK